MAKTQGEGGGGKTRRGGLVGDNMSSGKVTRTVVNKTVGKTPKYKTKTVTMKRTPTKPRY